MKKLHIRWHVWSGVGPTKPISSVLLFSKFFTITKIHLSYCKLYSYLTGGATAEILYICNIENFAHREINERIFSNPHPRIASIPSVFRAAYSLHVSSYSNKPTVEWTASICHTKIIHDDRTLLAFKEDVTKNKYFRLTTNKGNRIDISIHNLVSWTMLYRV